MKLYRVGHGKSTRFGELNCPVGRDGIPVDHRLEGGACPDHAQVETYDEIREYGDFLCAKSAFIVSKRAARILKEMRCTPEVKHVPTTIVDEAGRLVGECVTFCFCGHACDVLCREKSDFETLGRNSIIIWRFLKPPVIWADRVSGYDLILDIDIRWVCSERFREAVLRAKLTNFEFESLTLT